MLRKNKARQRLLARRFWNAFERCLERAYVALMWFFVRYLEGVRWKEFGGAVGAAFAAGTTMAITLQVPLTHAPYVGYLLAFFTAMSYLRMPKTVQAGLNQAKPDGGSATAESEGSDGSETKDTTQAPS